MTRRLRTLSEFGLGLPRFAGVMFVTPATAAPIDQRATLLWDTQPTRGLEVMPRLNLGG